MKLAKRSGKKIHGHSNSDGGRPSGTYRAWASMIARCTQPSSPAFAHYKKRGITTCERWRDFCNFLVDMGERPANTTLDREDNNMGYMPGNCRWVSKQTQANNRITNVRFTYRGAEYTLAELSRFTGVKKEILRSRLCRSGLPWTVEGAVSTPKLPRTKRRSGFYC
jgi:hypothetical protein